MESKDKEYPLIPMNDITDEARKLSVAWMECEDKNWIGQKHKLASDIMNYSKYQVESFRSRVIAELEGMKKEGKYIREGFETYTNSWGANQEIAINKAIERVEKLK